MPTARSPLRVFVAHLGYGIAVHLVALLAVVPHVLRTWRDPERRLWFRRRLGRLPEGLPLGRPIWIHAVSVGEVKASAPLVRELRRRHPELPLVLSTGTRTGFAAARRMDPDLYVFAWPLDLPSIVGSVLRRVDPRLLILLELEVWPAFLKIADDAGVPQVIVNARITETSFRSYRRLRWWLPEFDRLSFVAAQDEVYRARIHELGVPGDRLAVTGNLKHELPPPVAPGAVASLSGELGLADTLPVFVAGSTHDGEDELVVGAWRAAGGGEACRLVLVPRHLERVRDIGRLMDRLSVPWALRSDRPREQPPSTVLLVDTMGELELLFARADIVFLGGSLVPVGGHNVLEPAAAGCPVLVGPHLESCQREAAIVEDAGGLLVCPDGETLGRSLTALLTHPERRQEMASAARNAVQGLAGAAAADVTILEERGLLGGRLLQERGESDKLERPFRTHKTRPGAPSR